MEEGVYKGPTPQLLTQDREHEFTSAMMKMEKGRWPSCLPAGKLLFINHAHELAKFQGCNFDGVCKRMKST